MKLDISLEFIYKNCAERISKRKSDLGINASVIYPNDPKLISKITNCKRTKNNPFLIPDAVLECWRGYQEHYGIVAKLNFNSKQEVLWGNKKEIKNYLRTLFYRIFDDLLKNCDENKLKNIFLDYIPYAKCTAFYELLFRKESKTPFMWVYGIWEDKIMNDYFKFLENKEEIIEYLYQKCYLTFYDIFLSFVDETDTFHKIDKNFSGFVYGKFIPMLRIKTDEKTSLGMRVYRLILSDISMAEQLLTCENIRVSCTSNFMAKQLINVSSRYITELEKIQKKSITIK